MGETSGKQIFKQRPNERLIRMTQEVIRSGVGLVSLDKESLSPVLRASLTFVGQEECVWQGGPGLTPSSEDASSISAPENVFPASVTAAPRQVFTAASCLLCHRENLEDRGVFLFFFFFLCLYLLLIPCSNLG